MLLLVEGLLSVAADWLSLVVVVVTDVAGRILVPPATPEPGNADPGTVTLPHGTNGDGGKCRATTEFALGRGLCVLLEDTNWIEQALM